MNYTTEEYANDVVFSVMEACDAAQVPHPNLVSESGRAVAPAGRVAKSTGGGGGGAGEAVPPASAAATNQANVPIRNSARLLIPSSAG
jgi:mevalonate kinase